MSGPTIVCLCGSTRFGDAFRAANLRETLDGKIVLTVGCDFQSDDALGLSLDVKRKLDALRLAHEVLILNVDGYIGPSTRRELAYAVYCTARVRFLEEKLGATYLARERGTFGVYLPEFKRRREPAQ